jgi:hypothetical protein
MIYIYYLAKIRGVAFGNDVVDYAFELMSKRPSAPNISWFCSVFTQYSVVDVFHKACKNGHLDVVRWAMEDERVSGSRAMLAHGVLNLFDAECDSLKMADVPWVCERFNVTREWLLHGAYLDPLISMLRRGEVEIAEYLIERYKITTYDVETEIGDDLFRASVTFYDDKSMRLYYKHFLVTRDLLIRTLAHACVREELNYSLFPSLSDYISKPGAFEVLVNGCTDSRKVYDMAKAFKMQLAPRREILERTIETCADDDKRRKLLDVLNPPPPLSTGLIYIGAWQNT